MISILEKLRELRREEDGQSIVFGVISIFLVLMFGAMVLGVGRVATRRIQMQFAADSAAYSAATMESDCLNAIALLNSTMARTRARTLRYVSDVNMYGVLAELRDKVTEAGGERTADDLGTAINDLETELEDIDDEDERAYLEGKVDRLRRQRNRLYEDQDPEEGDIYEITDPEFWEQQVEELETQIEDVEEEIDDASGDIRDRLEEDLSRLEEQLELAEDRLDGGSDGSGSPSWIEEIVGMESPHVEYGARTEDGYDFDGAYARAERWVPAAEEWIKEMSRLSHSIATLAPYLSRETAYRVARKNGAEYVSIFPASRWMPREDDDRAVQVYNDTDPEKWRVEGGGEFIEVEQKPCGSFDICPPGTLDCEEVENCWRVAWGHGASIDSEYIICELEDRKWTVYSPETNCWEQVRAIQQREEVYTTTYGPEGVDVIRHGTDEGYDPPVLELVSEQGDVPDNTLFVRRVDAEDPSPRWDPDEGEWVTPDDPQGGQVQVAEYQWDDSTDEWVMPDEDDFEPISGTQVSVGGVRVGVTLDPVIPLPGQAEVRRLIPPVFILRDAAGDRWGTVELRDTTRITATINGVRLRIREGSATLWRRSQHRLSTENTRGRWHSHFDRREQYWWQHRLLPQDPPSASWDREWLYQYETFGTRLRREDNMARMMGIAGADPDMVDSMGYTEDVRHSGALNSAWTRTNNLPQWAHDPGEGESEGWLNVKSGERGGEVYQQVRECWYQLCQDGTLPNGEECPVCGGDERVTTTSSDVEERYGRIHRSEPEPSTDKDYLDASFDATARPLVLTEDFFRFGLTVGVWHRPESHFTGDDSGPPERPVEYLLHDPQPGMKGLVRGTDRQSARERGERVMPKWGYFAVAGARPRLNDAGGPVDDGGIKHGAYFRDPNMREEWLEDNKHNLYSWGGSGEWSYWDARLFPVSEQVLDFDIEQQLDVGPETGTGWLMRRIAYGAPGGRIASRINRRGYRNYAHYPGWATDIYGGRYDDYTPEAVRKNLLERMKPRRTDAGQRVPYVDDEGLYRDPFVEELGTRSPGDRPEGRPLDYNLLDDEDVTH